MVSASLRGAGIHRSFPQVANPRHKALKAFRARLNLKSRCCQYCAATCMRFTTIATTVLANVCEDFQKAFSKLSKSMCISAAPQGIHPCWGAEIKLGSRTSAATSNNTGFPAQRRMAADSLPCCFFACPGALPATLLSERELHPAKLAAPEHVAEDNCVNAASTNANNLASLHIEGAAATDGLVRRGLPCAAQRSARHPGLVQTFMQLGVIALSATKPHALCSIRCFLLV